MTLAMLNQNNNSNLNPTVPTGATQNPFVQTLNALGTGIRDLLLPPLPGQQQQSGLSTGLTLVAVGLTRIVENAQREAAERQRVEQANREKKEAEDREKTNVDAANKKAQEELARRQEAERRQQIAERERQSEVRNIEIALNLHSPRTQNERFRSLVVPQIVQPGLPGGGGGTVV